MKEHFCPAEKTTITYQGKCNWCGEIEGSMNEIIEMARQAGIIHPEMVVKHLEAFANLIAAKATEEANARANASWTLMCKKMVAFEREACEHDMEVLMNALWKACGDDAEVVNATIESQGELTRVRGEQE